MFVERVNLVRWNIEQGSYSDWMPIHGADRLSFDDLRNAKETERMTTISDSRVMENVEANRALFLVGDGQFELLNQYFTLLGIET